MASPSLILVPICLLLLTGVSGWGVKDVRSDESSSEESSSRESNRCRHIAGVIDQAVRTSLLITPARIREIVLGQYTKYLGIDVTNSGELRRLFCSLLNVKTLHDVDAILPASYDDILSFYKSLQDTMTFYGGYTGYWRQSAIRTEVGDWALSQGFTRDDTSIPDHVDLVTLTQFLKVMHVKYGSRWISSLLSVTNDKFLVEDVDKFAKDLHESKTGEELAERTGFLDEGNAGIMLQSFGWQTVKIPLQRQAELANERMLRVLGENGYLNLKY